jgi:hypothetical protein
MAEPNRPYLQRKRLSRSFREMRSARMHLHNAYQSEPDQERKARIKDSLDSLRDAIELHPNYKAATREVDK